MQELRVNTRLELQVLTGTYRGVYQTRIEDIRPDRILVAVPTVSGVAVLLTGGDAVRGRFVTGTACYEFESLVIGREGREVPTLALSLPLRLEKIQRRDFVRLDVQLPVRFTVVPRAGSSPAPAVAEPVTTRTMDLSAGGAAVILPRPLDAGTILDLTLSLRPGEELQVAAEIVRVLPPGPSGHLVAGCRFLGLNEAKRQPIVQFIFREQLERRRRGLV